MTRNSPETSPRPSDEAPVLNKTEARAGAKGYSITVLVVSTIAVIVCLAAVYAYFF